MHNDAARIKRLGGPAQLAKLLGFKEPGGTQRVQNWIKRGIPAQVKVDHPDLFLVGAKPPRKSRTARAAVEA